MRWLSYLGLEFVDAEAAASEGGGPRGCLIGGNVVVVMVLFFGHLGGEEQAAGDLGGVGLRQRHLPDCVLKAGLGDNDISQIVFQNSMVILK
jgi:hypothetical protein